MMPDRHGGLQADRAARTPGGGDGMGWFSSSDEAKALAAVKAAKVKDAKTFAEADKRLKVAKQQFEARKNAGKN